MVYEAKRYYFYTYVSIYTPMIRSFIVILLLIANWSANNFGQDFYRWSDDEDSTLVETYTDLITADPNEETVETYYRLAYALWNLQRNKEAQIMLQKIVESGLPQYKDTYYHGSDIPGDTTTNIYGYGSFTSSYKNSACLLLTKIFIEEKNYSEALEYLVAADKQYTITYNCGTGHHRYQGELRHLYGLCYEGLEQTDKAIDLLLPHCFDWNNKIILRILQAQYSADDIKKNMDWAINSITCAVDTFSSESYLIDNYGTEQEITTELTYVSGTGTIELFGSVITLPQPDLKDGETITRQHYVDQFLASSFLPTTNWRLFS